MDVIERNQSVTPQKTITNPQLTAVLTILAASIAGPPLASNLTDNNKQPVIVNAPESTANKQPAIVQPAIDLRPLQVAQDRLRDDLIQIVTQSSSNISNALESQSAILNKHDKKLSELYKWADHITDKVNEIGTAKTFSTYSQPATYTSSIIYSEPYYQTSSSNCGQSFATSQACRQSSQNWPITYKAYCDNGRTAP